MELICPTSTINPTPSIAPPLPLSRSLTQTHTRVQIYGSLFLYKSNGYAYSQHIGIFSTLIIMLLRSCTTFQEQDETRVYYTFV